MRKMVALVLVSAVAMVFAIPAFAGSDTCAKPCPPKPCPTCGQPCNILQSTANVINSMQAPSLCPKCATPCASCAKTAEQPAAPATK